MALKPVVGELVISDKHLMQTLLLSGKSTLSVKTYADRRFKPPDSKKPGGRVSQSLLEKLFKAVADKFPRLGVYNMDTKELTLRDFPMEDKAQDAMHNDFMRAVRLTARAVSEARVKWMAGAQRGNQASGARRSREESGPGEAGDGPSAGPRRRVR